MCDAVAWILRSFCHYLVGAERIKYLPSSSALLWCSEKFTAALMAINTPLFFRSICKETVRVMFIIAQGLFKFREVGLLYAEHICVLS